MALDLGELFATADIVDTPFQRKYTRLVGQLSELGARTAKSAAETSTLDEAYVGLGRSADVAAAGITKTTTAAKTSADAEAKAALATKGHADAIARVSEVTTPAIATASRLQAAQLRQIAAQENVNRVMASGVATTRQLATAQAGLITATRAVEAANGTAMARWGAVNAKAASVGKSLSHSLTLPIVAAAAVSVDQAVKFEKSMTLIQTAGGETEAKEKAIAAGIKKIAVETGTSLSDLSDGIYTVAKAGSQKWSATDQLLVLKAASQGAKAENVDLGTATNALTSVMMSYHLSASQAVATENQLIVGAGKAKTTQQEFAASLATVIPIASAAGISIAEVFGAEATLTQHGTSAKEATQELAFTIRNLQAPNNVAVSAMNQLGISSVNVSKNLGKRGLSGTLQYIESFLPKTGLVYLTTMKQMEAGTSDLNAMMAKMPASLQKLSQGFLDGSVSAKDYRKDFKTLGAEGYAQGSQFLSLAAKVSGYNDALKNGTPAQKTMAAELKQIFGGAVGLNTALQLGGENMAYFKSATAGVAAAAKNAGGDVLGWSKTQDTLAVKMAKGKEELQVLSVEVGTALIPAVAKMVGWVVKGVTAFEGLSSGQKKAIGIAVLVVAALGPVISILTRVSTAVMFVVKVFGLLATGAKSATVAVLRAFGVMATAAQTNAIAATTAAAETAQAEADKAAATAVAARQIATSEEEMSAAGRLAAEQAAGNAEVFAAAKRAEALAAAITAREVQAAAVSEGEASTLALGPVGLLVGGISAAVIGFGIFGRSAKDQVKPTDDFTNAIKQDNLALGANTRLLVVNKLEKDGLYDSALKLGIAQKTLTDAMMGNGAAAGAVDKVLANYKTTLDHTTAREAGGGAALAAKYRLYDKLKSGLSNVTETLKANQQAALNEAAANSTAGKVADKQAAQLKNLAAAQKKLSDSTASLNKQIALHGTTLQAGTKDGNSNLAMVTRQIKAFHDLGIQQAEAGVSIAGVIKQQDANAAAFRKQAVAAGLNGAAIDQLIATYRLTPRQIVTVLTADISKGTANAAQLQAIITSIRQGKVPGITANSAQGKAVIAEIVARINSISQKKIPTIGVNAGPALTDIGKVLNALLNLGKTKVTIPSPTTGGLQGGLLPGRAAGGPVPEGMFVVGEQGPELGIKSGSKVDIISNAHSKALIAQTGLKVPGFAAGTVSPAGQAAVSAAITAATVTKPVDIPTLEAAKIATTTAALIAETKALAALAVSDKATASLNALAAADKKAEDAAKAHAKALADEAYHATGDRKKQLEAEAHDASVAASKLVAADNLKEASLKKLADTAKASYDTVSQAAKDAVTSAADAAKALVDQIQQNVDAMKSTVDGFESSMKSSIQGDDSLSTLWSQLTGGSSSAIPTAADLQAKLDGILAQTQTFTGDLNQLVTEGASQDMISQIAGMGAQAGDALAQQLLAAGPQSIAALQQTMTSISTLAGSEANNLAGDFYSAGSNSMLAFVKGLQAKMPALTDALAPIIAELQALYAANPAGATPPPTILPSYASGVTNFTGGLAYVHQGEALVNMPKGTDVIKRSKVPAMWGGSDDRVVDRLERIEQRLSRLPQQFGDVTLSGFKAAGHEQARQNQRYGRAR